MDSKTAILVAVLTSSGIFAVLGAALNGVFTKRKLGAEATEIITKAASGVVSDLERQRDDLRADMDRMKGEHKAVLEAIRADHAEALANMAREHADEREDWRRVLQLHVAWDYIAIEKMSHVGIELPPPPPILPPLDKHRVD